MANGPPTDLAGYDPTCKPGEYEYNPERGEHACQFIEALCCHIKGQLAGTPLILESWQSDLIRTLFGWIHPATGYRRFRIAYVEVPRKNGKSTLAAAIALYLLFFDEEPGAEVYSAAHDREQAGLVFQVAAAMCRKHPALAKRCKILDSVKRIVVGDSFYRAVPSESAGAHGYNSHGIIADEVHTWEHDGGHEFWRVLTTSTGSRTQPLTFGITTAGFDRESICYALHQHAEHVRDGIVEDPAFLPVLYGASESHDWTSEATWRIANPNLGVSISLDYLRGECARAKESPLHENAFRRLHLNQWTEQDVRWLQMAKWDLCDANPDDLERQPCFMGLDLASTTDIAAAVLYWPHNGSVVPHFWVPKEGATDRAKRAAPQYQRWIAEGLITQTDGDVIDYEVIRKTINDLPYKVQKIGIDRWNATHLSTELADDGLTVEGFGQGYASMSAPAKELDGLVRAGRLRHGGHKVLRWMASNVAVEQDAAGNIKPSKKKSTEKIDGIVALTMAIGLAMTAGDQRSIYDRRGVISI